MSQHLKKLFYLFLVLILGLWVSRCTAPREELHAHGDIAPVKTYPKDYVHPLTEINLEKVFKENRGMKVLEENATMFHDYYRGGVQEKEEAETVANQGKWEEARVHLEKSNKFLFVVLRYLSEDEAYRNIYGDHVISYLPNLLMADNFLDLISIYKKTGRDDKVDEAERYGKEYVDRSLKSVKTEWAFQIEKELEGAFRKK